MMSSMSAVFEANSLLDSIDEKGADEFALSRLEEIRTQMIIAGFNTPFASVLAATRAEGDDWSAQDGEDMRKQVGNMRYIASLKKFTLNRVRTAIAAQKTFAALREIGMEDAAAHLPLGGSYRKMLLSRGHYAVEAYRKLMSSFATHAFDYEGAAATIMVDGGAGEMVKREVMLSGTEGAAEKLLGMFGPDTKIGKVEKRQRKAGLIRNYSAKVALLCAASLAGAKVADAQMGKTDDEKVAKYNLFLKRHGLSENADLSDTEGLQKIKEHAVQEGHMRKVDGEYVLEDEFAEALAKRRKHGKKIAEEAACGIVLRALMRHYVSMNENGRKAGGIPSAMPSPSEKQLAVLAHIAPKDYPVAHLPKVVAEKIAMEAKSPPFKPQEWGPAFVCARANVDAEWAGGEFGVDATGVEGALQSMKSLLHQPEGRGAKFLEGARKTKVG